MKRLLQSFFMPRNKFTFSARHIVSLAPGDPSPRIEITAELQHGYLVMGPLSHSFLLFTHATSASCLNTVFALASTSLRYSA